MRAADCGAWQSSPLEAVYAVVFLDALRVKIREDAVVTRLVNGFLWPRLATFTARSNATDTGVTPLPADRSPAAPFPTDRSISSWRFHHHARGQSDRVLDPRHARLRFPSSSTGSKYSGRASTCTATSSIRPSRVSTIW